MKEREDRTPSGPRDSAKIDPVRASRDGHQFHEAWAARSALALLPPDTNLVAIAMEGFGREDEGTHSQTATEVADLVRYYGGRSITEADRIEVVQFKYSIADADTPVRASDLRATVAKFAKGEAERIQRFGAEIAGRAHYEFATNRPVHPNLFAALAALAKGSSVTGDTDNQANMIRTILEEASVDARAFCGRVTVVGRLDSLQETRQGLRREIANWSAPGDPQTRIRLLGLEHLMRKKAGSAGQADNLIERVTVLNELEIDHEDDLYPTEDAFPEVGAIVVRPLLDDLVANVKAATLPLVVHAEGGFGKTVLMQALADRLKASHAVVLFDGFGAGKWREPAHPRHLASRTLLHLANVLAARGLCDLLLPSTQEEALLRGFRLRLSEAVAAVRQTDPGAGVALVLDAIDHAAIAARETGANSFAYLLLKSLSIDPIDGVLAVASCRTSRLELTRRDIETDEFPVPAFSPGETRELVLARDPSATSADIAALATRSGCNPRNLAAFLDAGRPYDPQGPQQSDPGDILESLLRERITVARREALRRGATQAETGALLAGLAMLPPPVPVNELAAAQGLSVGDIESFASDLAPLLERTRYGLMFRDEPTETLIRQMSEEDPVARELVISRLTERQSGSDYAARALPQVLTATGQVDDLVALAFDSALPAGASEIAKQEIRLARIVAALRATARAGRTDDLFRLALEASLVTSGHERADRFLYEHPDLVALSGDQEARRRLFATKTGWPGGRHSSLALAYAFAGEFDEAERHATRSIDWHRQRAADRDDHIDHPSSALDRIGFSYVELLLGDDRRIFSWLKANGDAFAYDIVLQSLVLGDRHAAGGRDGPDMSLARRKLARCPLAIRGALAAALMQSDGNRGLDEVFVRRLASTPGTEEYTLPLEALLVAQLRALDLGCRAEAMTIAGALNARANTVFAFEEYRLAEMSPVHAVIGAGLEAALKRRPAALIDIAPSELYQLVPKSLRTKGPATFERELVARLTGRGPRSSSHRSRVGKSAKYKPQERARFEREKSLLEHRVRPALGYAERVRSLVEAAPSARGAIISDWLDAVEKDVSTASQYPFKEGAAFIARLAGLALVLTGTVLEAFDADTALRLATLLADARDMPIDPLIWSMERLSRNQDLHKAVMTLAKRTESLIVKLTETSARLNEYGRLARAVWRTSPEDAAFYFRRGLDLAEALGADDFERANSLLQLAPHFHGPPLAEEAAHTLPRVFELQFSDADRYPWFEWSEAMHGVLGRGTLAAVSRLDDRDTAALSFTLVPTLRSLTLAGTLSPQTAAALICLAPNKPTKGARLDRLVDVVLPGLAVGYRERLFEIVLREIDCHNALFPDARVVAGLRRLAALHLPPDSPMRRRLEGLRRQPDADDASPTRGNRSEEPEPPTIPFDDVDAISSVVLATEGNGYYWPKRVLEALVLRADRPKDRLALLRVFPSVAGADLGDKLTALEPVLSDWSGQSPAIGELLPDVGRGLISHHAEELAGTSWEVIRSWRRLTGGFGLKRAEIAALVIRRLGPDALLFSGEDWLSLSAEVAPAVSQGALGTGLEHVLRRIGDKIPDEIGDGPWRDAYSAPTGEAESVAGLLWMRLGHPDAAMRWRATHALYELARFDRFDIIDAVVARYDGDGGAYSDPELPLFVLNSKQWLLLALGRIARDYPDRIAKHRTFLKAIALNSAFPHPAIREAALVALRHGLAVISKAKRTKEERSIYKANRSPFPAYKGTRFYFDAHDMPPEGERDPDAYFHFDYDFQKYQIADVARLFREEPWKIRRRIVEIVREHDPKIRSMSFCPRPHYQNDRSSSWSGGYAPEKDRYGGYLAQHALQIVAGEMLATRAVSRSEYHGDDWGGFLRSIGLSRSDHAWLAEWTDLTPLEVGSSMPMPESDRSAIYDADDERLLSEPIGLLNREIGSRGLVVAGDWTGSGHSYMHASSLMAPAGIAKAALLAAMLIEPFHRGLPIADEDGDNRYDFPGHASSVRNWINTRDHSDRSLDRYDPFGAATAQARPTPGSWLRDTHGIARADDAGRLWLAGERLAFAGEAWGGPDGRSDERGGGDWLRVEKSFLLEILKSTNLVLAGYVQARMHREDDRKKPDDRMVHRTFGYLIDGTGRVTVIKQVPKAIRLAVDQLGRYGKYEFSKRFTAILPHMR
ncbi:hypothetical protein [Sphingobium lactosutens]|uniref:hypothetical protein n=1 Tax=Sphingobium lactosutens TaxID=522773 RepID=UPI001D189080|nr:hypothetical protein [Sphingobium lactosutens]MCC4256354.1 hypothetical protein [Sphingobium lactosutens]